MLTVIVEVRDYHRKYKEEGLNTRDVMIVAHGHFSRVLISRWINFDLCLGDPIPVVFPTYSTHICLQERISTLSLDL